MMRFISIFSGIGGVELAWAPEWDCVASAETDGAASAVLRYHWPDNANLGDVTKITQIQINKLGPVDAVFAGWPCQDVSVSGQRKGFTNADGTSTRSGLFYHAAQIYRWSRARWFVGENVPGLFSVNEWRDFAAVVGELVGTKFGVPGDGWRNTGFALGPRGLLEWSVLDAKWFGLAQRRKRVFFVFDSGNWQDRPPILSEREILCGHPPPRRETGQETTGGTSPSLSASGRGTSRAGESRGQDCVIPIAHSLRAEGFDASEDGTGRGTPLVVGTLTSDKLIPENDRQRSECDGTYIPAVADCLQERDSKGSDSSTKNGHLIPTFESQAISYRTAGNCGPFEQGDKVAALNTATDPNQNIVCQIQWASGGGQVENPTAQALRAGAEHSYKFVRVSMAVRRLTPIECEKLQGFPPDWTKFGRKPDGKIYQQKDGPRYRQLGNAVAVPVVRWIANSIRKHTQTT